MLKDRIIGDEVYLDCYTSMGASSTGRVKITDILIRYDEETGEAFKVLGTSEDHWWDSRDGCAWKNENSMYYIVDIEQTKSYIEDDRLAINRLIREYKEHGSLVIGYDFDSTIYDYHKENLDLQPVIDLLKRCSRLGFIMCLHTLCLNEEGSMSHSDKDNYCTKLGIEVKYINYSPILDNQPDDVPMKPFYSILLDDRAGLSASYDILKTVLDELDL